MLTSREFVAQAYRLISADSPTVPLHGSDLSLGIRILNQLLESYAATGLMITVAKTVSLPIEIGQEYIVTGGPDVLPTPDVTEGRLANIDSAWLLLNGVTYPLIEKSQAEFYAAWKYDPLKGLPRFVIVIPNIETVALRIYPAPSQQFEFNMRAKFQLPKITANTDLSSLPAYYQRYFMFAVARDIAPYKGRADAWTPSLERLYVEARDQMEAASEINVAITGDRDSLLNGAWRVKSGT